MFDNQLIKRLYLISSMKINKQIYGTPWLFLACVITTNKLLVNPMEYSSFIIARALHIVAVVMWIGGVAFVTTVLIPSLRSSQSLENKLNLFELLEGKFGFQAKLTTLVTGISGFYMIYVLNAWATMQWWIHLMIFIWVIFTLVLFVFEPLFLHKWFHQKAQKNNEKAFFFLQLMHTILLSLSLLAVFCGVAGTHGLFY